MRLDTIDIVNEQLRELLYMKKFKFRATLKNIETGSSERIEEGVFSRWEDALEYFSCKLYKTVGDMIVKLEIVSVMKTVDVETPV